MDNIKKYIVDEIIDDYVLLEDENEKIIEIKKNQLPANIHEGAVVLEKNSVYYLDETKEKDKRQELRERLERLKKKKNE